MANENETLSVLKEILIWTRVGFFATAKKTLAEVLDTDKKKLAYQMADGSQSLEAVRIALKMSPNGVTDLYKQCANLGLMEQLEGGKRRRLFDLTIFGLLPVTAEKGEQNEQTAK